MKNFLLAAGLGIGWFIFYSLMHIANGGIGKLPKNGEIINTDHRICIQTAANSGSGEWVTINTYQCDDVNKKMLDQLDTDECVDSYIKSASNSTEKVLYITKTFGCRLFNTDTPEVFERRYTVNENGQFIKVKL